MDVCEDEFYLTREDSRQHTYVVVVVVVPTCLMDEVPG